jgi:long-chain acyl-CoA synthetase
MRLNTFIDAHATRTPDKTAVVVGECRWTYRELSQSIAHVARGLHRQGLKSGDRIAVYLPNGIEFVTLTYAAWSLGAVMIPVNTRNTLEELAYFVADSGATMLALQGSLAEGFQSKFETEGPLTLISVSEGEGLGISYASLAQPSTGELPDVSVADDDAVIMYTAGTTGKPKGAVLTHPNFVITNGFSNTVQWGITENDVNLVTTPLAHRTGLARMVNALCLGATLVVMKRFDAESALQLIEDEGVTVVGMVPTVGRMMLSLLKTHPDRARSLRHLLVTGEAFPVELKRELAAMLPQVRLCSFFAMTEAGAVTGLTHEEQFSHPTSVGRPSPGIEVKLTNETGDRVQQGEVGEILVRAGAPGRFTIMKQYHGRPEATAEAITDGWFRTGDLGRFDEQGYLYIVDRKKDMVLSGGFNIYTKEVEQTLLQHPDIADAAVVGVPDPIFGEAVVAFIQLQANAHLSAESVQAFAKEKIASYKKPKHVFFRDDFPRNALGKVLKAELRSIAEQEVSRAH